MICSRNKSKLSYFINNNVGVCRRSPISAQLFIIYDGAVMEKYMTISDTKQIPQLAIMGRNQDAKKAEGKWAEYQISQHQNLENKQNYT